MSGAPLPSFDFDPTPGAYRWWYFDALSDDGESVAVAIFFVGSVFSPAYAKNIDRKTVRASSEHVAVNFAVVRRGEWPLWVFSEYDSSRLSTGDGRIAIAGSSIERSNDGSISVAVDDWRVALRSRVRASMQVTPLESPIGDARGIALGNERHRWRCHAPKTRVVVDVPTHGIHFTGTGYHDENWGDEPPSRSLRSWSWGRVHAPDRTRVFFDVTPIEGPRTHLVFDSKSGAHEERREPVRLRRSLRHWLLALPERMDAGRDDSGNDVAIRESRSLERAPFYHRFVAPFGLAEGEAPTLGIAEHVDFRRFARSLVRGMIDYRIAEPDRGRFGRIP